MITKQHTSTTTSVYRNRTQKDATRGFRGCVGLINFKAHVHKKQKHTLEHASTSKAFSTRNTRQDIYVLLLELFANFRIYSKHLGKDFEAS